MGNDVVINWSSGTNQQKAILSYYCQDGILQKSEISNLTPAEKAILETQFSNINLDGKRDISLASWLESMNQEELEISQAGASINNFVTDPATTAESAEELKVEVPQIEEVKSPEGVQIPPVTQDGDTLNRKKAENLADNLGKFQKAENTLGGAIAGGLAGLALVKLGAKLGLAGGAIGSIIGGIAGALLGAAIAYIGTKKHVDNTRERDIELFEMAQSSGQPENMQNVPDEQPVFTEQQSKANFLGVPVNNDALAQINPVPEVVVANLTSPSEYASADKTNNEETAEQVDESKDSKLDETEESKDSESDKEVKSDETKEEKDSAKKDEELEEEK